jgi:hypothetical protein
MLHVVVLFLQGWVHSCAGAVQQALHHRASMGQVPHTGTAQCHQVLAAEPSKC